MYQNHLKKNGAKTEFITFGSRSGLKKQYFSDIKVGNDVEIIRFLGITLDRELDMKKFILAKAITSYFNIQQESQRAYGTAERDSYVIFMLIPTMANIIV